jgi:hypothetical protein
VNKHIRFVEDEVVEEDEGVSTKSIVVELDEEGKPIPTVIHKVAPNEEMAARYAAYSDMLQLQERGALPKPKEPEAH